MKEENKIMIHTIANGVYKRAAEVSLKSAAHATFSVDSMLVGDYKTAASSAATAIVMAPISAATGVLLAGSSVVVGGAVLTAATVGMATNAIKSMTQKTATKMVAAQR